MSDLYKYSIDGKVGASIPVTDRGLHYGDGVFETIAFIDQKPVLWREHMLRLNKGCECLQFKTPSSKYFLSEIKPLLPSVKKSVIKIIISRGGESRGYRPSANASARIILISYKPHNDLHLKQKKIEFCETKLCLTPWSRNASLAGLKTLNCLERVLAQQECASMGIDEGVMTDGSNACISGTTSNLFILSGNTLSTPNLIEAGVSGTMRQYLLEKASELSLDAKVIVMTQKTVEAADAAFFCNSVKGIWPIRKFENKLYGRNKHLEALQALIGESLGLL